MPATRKKPGKPPLPDAEKGRPVGLRLSPAVIAHCEWIGTGADGLALAGRGARLILAAAAEAGATPEAIRGLAKKSK